MTLKQRIAQAADGSKTARELARQFGCHVDYVYTACTTHGGTLKPAPHQIHEPNKPGGPWTDETVALLRSLWAEGLSASRIAGRIGGVTRNAVIGKVHRLGLTKSDNGAQKFRSTPARPKPTGRRSKSPEMGRVVSAAHLMVIEPYTTGPEIVIPAHERKGVLDLEDCDCRWPIGDPQHADFHFCGKTKVAGLPYCEHHARRAYTDPSPAGRVTRASRLLERV